MFCAKQTPTTRPICRGNIASNSPHLCVRALRASSRHERLVARFREDGRGATDTEQPAPAIQESRRAIDTRLTPEQIGEVSKTVVGWVAAFQLLLCNICCIHHV